MTISTGSTTALDILKETRELFAQTHWTTGLLYSTDSTGKKKFCMIGGLCHIFATKEFPEWIENHQEGRQSFYANTLTDYFDAEQIEQYPFEELLKAERELAKTVNPDITDASTPLIVEDAIISWNDSTKAQLEFAQRGDAGYILEKMDETIARLEKQS